MVIKMRAKTLDEKEEAWHQWQRQQIVTLETALKLYANAYLLGPGVAQDALAKGEDTYNEMVEGLVPNLD